MKKIIKLFLRNSFICFIFAFKYWQNRLSEDWYQQLTDYV